MVGWLPVAFVLQSFDFSESMCEDVEEEEEEEEEEKKEKKRRKKNMNVLSCTSLIKVPII